MENKINLKVFVEIGILAAIAFILHLLEKALFNGIWVNGGGIAISILPIII